MSPHTWGCSYQCCFPACFALVVPTYVGVFLTAFLNWNGVQRCPHIRGGVPAAFDAGGYGNFVVPTYVGVFLCLGRMR